MDDPAPPLQPIRTAADAAALLAPLFEGAQAESIAILYLDASRRRLGLGRFPGSDDEAELPVRAIVAEALRLGADGLLVAHNHPSGNPEPSPGDVEATRDLAETARRMGLRVVDHLVFGGGAWTSFRELQLL